MSILLSCECGKKLRARDEWRGTKVKCPVCGTVMFVPEKPAPVAPRPPSPAIPKSASPTKNSDADTVRLNRESATPPAPPSRPPEKIDGPEESGDTESPRVRKKKRKKSKQAGGGFEFPAVDILGIHMTLRKWLAFACALILLGGVLYVFVPSYRCKVLDARWVDAYAALEVGERNMGKEILGMQSNQVDGIPMLYPGGNKFLIVRDTPEGESVLVSLRLPPKFMHEHANFDAAGTLNLREQEFLLQGEGEPVRALLVDMERKAALDGKTSVFMDFSKSGLADPVIPRKRAPWFPRGHITNHYEIATTGGADLIDKSKMMQSPRDLHQEQDKSVVIQGTGAFHSRHGMEVNYKFEGSGAEVTWDPQSKAYIATIYQGLGSSSFMLANLDIYVVFPRPEGNDLTLTVMGQRVGKIKPH